MTRFPGPNALSECGHVDGPLKPYGLDARTAGYRKPDVAGHVLSVSRHLRVLPHRDGSFAAFHSLFGNLAILDAELGCWLEHSRNVRRSIVDFRDELGADTADALHAAYFLACDGEERALTNAWLAERSENVSSGHYLGGLQITSSNACNFTCAYCFADSSDRRSPARQAGAGEPTMSFETACEAIDRVRATASSHGRGRIGVKFLGREPLINYQMIERLFDHYRDGEVAWSLTTNGSLITPKVAARLAAAGVRVIVSIDGLPKTNDALRQVKSSRGEQSAYKLAMRGLQALLLVGVDTSVSSVVSAETDFSQMPEFFRTIATAGCREIELTLVMQTGTLQAQSQYTDQSAFVGKLVELYAEATRAGLFVSGDWIDPYHAILANHKFRDETAMFRPHGVACQATEHQISVEPNGDLFPCRAMSLHYGSLSNWDDALASDAYRKVVMRTFYAVPYCRGCPLEGHCQGTCLGSLEEDSGDIYSPQASYCNVYRDVAVALLSHRNLVGVHGAR